jgi:hypothetical protein
MDGAHLSSWEIRQLVLSILEGIDAVEAGDTVRDSWADEMRDWCDLLLSRIYQEGGPHQN